MIRLGYTPEQKSREIEKYCKNNEITNVVIISPDRWPLSLSLGVKSEQVRWEEVTLYRVYYRLLQEISKDTLIVINECLRSQNRHDLSYNCVRHFLNQTKHKTLFQWLPLIDTLDDFMILVDLATRDKWRREPWRRDYLPDLDLKIKKRSVTLSKLDVILPKNARDRYDKARDNAFGSLGGRDPHIIPRQLHLLHGKEKAREATDSMKMVGRNNRLKIPNMIQYKDVPQAKDPAGWTVFEFCHRFIDFSDFISCAQIRKISAMVADVKVDAWYYARLQQWTERVEDAYAAIYK